MKPQENPYAAPTVESVALQPDEHHARPEYAAKIMRWMAWAGILYNGLGLPIAISMEMNSRPGFSDEEWRYIRFMIIIAILLVSFFVALLACSFVVNHDWPKWRGVAKILLIGTGLIFFPVLTLPSFLAIRALGSQSRVGQ